MNRPRGWRSARSRWTAGLDGLTLGSAVQVAPVVPTPASPGWSSWFTWPWKGVEWNISFVASLVFCWVIITYEAKVASVAVVAGIIGLIFTRQTLRFPLPLLLFGFFNLISVAGYSTTQWPEFVKEGMTALWKLWLISFVLFNAVRSREQVRFFLFFYLACFAFYPVRGALFNYFLYHASLRDGRIAWNYVFGNPNDLAALLFFPLGLSAGLLFVERKKYIRWAAMAGVIIVPFVIFLTQSRAGLIALAFFGLFAFLGHSRHIRAMVAGAAVLAAAALFAPSSVWTRLSNLQQATDVAALSEVNDEGSAEQRFEIWRVALAITKDHVVAGVGVGAYPYVHGEYARRAEFKPIARGRKDTHSTFLNLLAETGIAGFLLFMGVLLACVIPAERVRRRLKQQHHDAERQLYFLEVGLIAFLVSALFGTYGTLSFTYIHLFSLWIFAEAYRKQIGATVAHASRGFPRGAPMTRGPAVAAG